MVTEKKSIFQNCIDEFRDLARHGDLVTSLNLAEVINLFGLYRYVPFLETRTVPSCVAVEIVVFV